VLGCRELLFDLPDSVKRLFHKHKYPHNRQLIGVTAVDELFQSCDFLGDVYVPPPLPLTSLIFVFPSLF